MALTCRLSVLVMFAFGREMLTLVILVVSSHLDSSSMVRSLSNLARLSTWKGSRSTMLALPRHRGASRTCTMFSMSSWKRYKPGGKDRQRHAEMRRRERRASTKCNIFASQQWFGAGALDGTRLRCWFRLELFSCDTVALKSRLNSTTAENSTGLDLIQR